MTQVRHQPPTYSCHWWLLATACWLALTPHGNSEASAGGRGFDLQLPAMGAKRFAPGVVQVAKPENLARLSIHIPLTKVFRVHIKLNAIPLGLVQDLRQLRTHAVCNLDLRTHAGSRYELERESNTLEISVTSSPGTAPLVARWVITTPQESTPWQRHKTQSIKVAAELAGPGAELFEVLEDGSQRQLNRSLTVAQQVVARVAFAQRSAEIGLRATWRGEDDRPRTLSIGSSSDVPTRGSQPLMDSGNNLALPIDLEVGVNRIKLEVIHGAVVLAHSSYRVRRQRVVQPGQVDGERWAVVIGISEYNDESIRDLSFARRDAEAFRNLLLSHGGFRPQRVRLLVDSKATKDNIHSALFSFLAQTAPDDLVLIYFAGHGVRGLRNPENLYFLAADSRIESLGSTSISFRNLDSSLGHTIRARQVALFTDACHSGGAMDAGAAQGAGLSFVNKYLERLADKQGRLVVTASQAHEKAFEKSGLGHGIFTYQLLRGLHGDADTDGDKVISFSETIDFLRAKVPESSGRRQHPTFHSTDFDLDLGLAYLEQALSKPAVKAQEPPS